LARMSLELTVSMGDLLQLTHLGVSRILFPAACKMRASFSSSLPIQHDNCPKDLISPI
jgi:hypothetical protein